MSLGWRGGRRGASPAATSGTRWSRSRRPRAGPLASSPAPARSRCAPRSSSSAGGARPPAAHRSGPARTCSRTRRGSPPARRGAARRGGRRRHRRRRPRPPSGARCRPAAAPRRTGPRSRRASREPRAGVCGRPSRARLARGGCEAAKLQAWGRHQRKTTVFGPFISTRCSTCQRTARARTTLSTSRPTAVKSSGVRLWSTRATSCSMIGPSSRSAVT